MPSARRSVAARAVAVAAFLTLALPATAIGLGQELPPSESGRYVYDLAEVWEPRTRDEAQAIAVAIRDRTGAQLAIVSWPSGLSSVTTATARVDARTIMDTWGVGRAGVDDGLVVLFDLDTTLSHGQIYLYTGAGFRDMYLSDAEAASVVNGLMLPKAKEGDLDAALLAGLRDVDRLVQPGGNPDRGTRGLQNLLLQGGLLLFGLLAIGLFLRTWWLRGRDAQVPLIDDSVLLPSPPPGMTPALATVLRKDGVAREAFTAALVDLGHRGLVTFSQVADDEKHVDLLVRREPLGDPASLEARRRPLGAAEQSLHRAILARSSPVPGEPDLEVLTWEKLKAGKGKELYDDFRKRLGPAAKAAGFFRDDPNRLTGRWLGIGIGVVVAVVVFGFVFAFDMSEETGELFKPGRDFLGLPMLLVAAAGVGIALLSRVLAARTVDGARALAMSMAYRNTLRWEMKASRTVDEAVDRAKSRLPWITTPDLLTVWAVALGLKSDIDRLIQATFEAAQRTGTTAWAPAWYSGSGDMSGVSNLSGMIGSISTTSASSSGSGYGGGGGGGGGGAGGGF